MKELTPATLLDKDFTALVSRDVNVVLPVPRFDVYSRRARASC